MYREGGDLSRFVLLTFGLMIINCSSCIWDLACVLFTDPTHARCIPAQTLMWFIPLFHNVPNEIKHQRETNWGAQSLSSADCMSVTSWRMGGIITEMLQGTVAESQGEHFYNGTFYDSWDVTACLWYAGLTREGATCHACCLVHYSTRAWRNHFLLLAL